MTVPETPITLPLADPVAHPRGTAANGSRSAGSAALR
jgi:hypothetical protein